MKITGVKLWLTTLHTHHPFKIAFEVLDECHGILLELLTDDGMSGFGEAVPARRITGETDETVASILKNILIPAVRGLNPLNLHEIHCAMDESVVGNPSAKAALDMACIDLAGKKEGKPAVSVLGGEVKSLPTDHTIGIDHPNRQAEQAAELVARGFRILKVKLGADPREDVERVRTIRKQVGPDIILRVDANQGWSVEEAAKVLEEIAQFNIELAEQPVPWHDLKGLSFLKKRSPIPIAADESIHSPHDAGRLVEMGACHIINIKLMKCGGIYRAKQIAEIAKKADLACMIGGMIGESELAVSAAAHFAASQPVIRYYDLDADLLLRDRLVDEEKLGLQDGRRILSESPGFGVVKFNSQFLTSLVEAYV